MSLNSRGLCVFYIYSGQYSLEREQKQMMCVGIVMGCILHIVPVCVCVCVRACARALSLPLWELHAVVISLLIIIEDFCRQREEIFCCGIAVIGQGFQLHLNTLTEVVWQFRDIVHFDFL